MRRLFFLTLFVLVLAVPSVLAQDATKVDSRHYKVEFENSQGPDRPRPLRSA